MSQTRKYCLRTLPQVQPSMLGDLHENEPVRTVIFSCFAAILRTLQSNESRYKQQQIHERQSALRAQHDRGILSYVVDVTAVADRVDGDLARFRDAMALIVEDEVIQDGAAKFRGTRILVNQIAELLAQGADEAELCEDYPQLTPAMLAAAPIYARAHPGRGRPKSPAWRKGAVVSKAGKQRGV